MLYTPNIVPGSGFETFYITEKTTTITSGHTVNSYTEQSEDKAFWGILAQASQSEVEKFNQLGHPITHVIVQHGATIMAKPTDILKSKSTGRSFYVEGVESPSGIASSVIYQVKERMDVGTDNS